MIILFDLDGTLIDSTEAILESFHRACRVNNFESPSDEAIKALIGYPLDAMFLGVGVSEEVVWDFVSSYKEHYRVISTQKTELLAYAENAVKLANQFATLGIVTTKTGEYSKILMEYFGLMEYFKVLIGRENVVHPKPNAEPILNALKELNIDDQEIWMIGDTKLDLIAAKNANINSIGVLSGYDSEKTLAKHTNNIYKNAFDAVEYLQNRKK